MSKTSSPNSAPGSAPGDDGSTPLAKMLFGWTSAKSTANLFFYGIGLLSIILLAADFFIERHAYKPIRFSEMNMFYGLYGFAAFAFVVVCGWPLGNLLRKDENYYHDLDEAGDDVGKTGEGE